MFSFSLTEALAVVFIALLPKLIKKKGERWENVGCHWTCMT